MIYLDLDSLLHIAARTLGGEPVVRDYGLLESALARPRASAFGEDAYPDVYEKAAALLHSLVRNPALVDGNKRLGLAATLAFLGINGEQLTLSNDEAYDLVIAIATGALDDVPKTAAVLRENTAPSPDDRRTTRLLERRSGYESRLPHHWRGPLKRKPAEASPPPRR